MVRVMFLMVDDVISANFVTSKALNDDFTRDYIREVMTLVKELGALEGSDDHFIVTQLFKHASNREIFLTFETNEGMFNWLKRYYEEQKKVVVQGVLVCIICTMYFDMLVSYVFVFLKTLCYFHILVSYLL
jgi:hypothetical protein